MQLVFLQLYIFPLLVRHKINMAKNTRVLLKPCWMGLILLLLSAFLVIATSKIITTLPGYSGKLPFRLETGSVIPFLTKNNFTDIFVLGILLIQIAINHRYTGEFYMGCVTIARDSSIRIHCNFPAQQIECI